MKTPKYPGLIPLLAQRCRDKATNWLLNLIIGGCARARGTFQISKQPTQARASPWKIPKALPSQKLKQRLRCKAKRRQCALNHLCESPHMRISALLFSALAGCGLVASAPVAGEDMTASPMDGAAAAINLEGRMIGLNRQPLLGITVSLCQQVCRDTTTGSQGEFSFPQTRPNFYTLRARKPGASDSADLDFPLYLDRNSNPRLLPLVLPKIDYKVPVLAGSQTVAVDQEQQLSLTLDQSALAFPKGAAQNQLGAVAIPQDLFPNFCVPSAHVVGMWAFSPAGTASSAPIGIRVANSLGLAPNASVSFIEIAADGRPTETATAVVSKDGAAIQTVAGSGVKRLSWLLAAVFYGGA